MHYSLEVLDTTTIGTSEAKWSLVELNPENYEARGRCLMISLKPDEILIIGG